MEVDSNSFSRDGFCEAYAFFYMKDACVYSVYNIVCQYYLQLYGTYIEIHKWSENIDIFKRFLSKMDPNIRGQNPMTFLTNLAESSKTIH